MTPESETELHLRTVAEMVVMRILFTCLCRQSPDAKALLADFEQSVEEVIHAEELRTLQRDHRLDFFASLYSKSAKARSAAGSSTWSRRRCTASRNN